MLHDVGKLGVPTRVLQKTGALTDEEFATIARHPVRGLEMVREIAFLGEAFQGILHHHERLDGRGYPMGLIGRAIPEFARIIAVADAFDSMTSTRSYRRARSVEEALEELDHCRGTQFDPQFVAALTEALQRTSWTPAARRTTRAARVRRRRRSRRRRAARRGGAAAGRSTRATTTTRPSPRSAACRSSCRQSRWGTDGRSGP